MRILFHFVALCIGFMMVLGTVLGVTAVAGGLMDLRSGPSGQDDYVILFGAVLVAFLVFARIASRFLRTVVPPAPPAGQETDSSQEDARIMQQIYNGLTQMERRIESLETLLVDRERDREHAREPHAQREAPWMAQRRG